MATMMMVTAVITMQQQQGGRLQDESDMSGFACLLLGVGLPWTRVDKLKIVFHQVWSSDLSKMV